MDTPSSADTRVDAASHARFVQRVRRRHAAELPLLSAGEPDRRAFDATAAALEERGLDFAARLRTVRNLVVERLAVLDTDDGASLDVVMRTTTALAEWSIDAACREAERTLDAIHGVPRPAAGTTDGGSSDIRAVWCVVGMGKFGARELNVSSDVDLVHVYDADGETDGVRGRNRISNHEYFGKAARILHTLVGDTTEHGFVFRIDTALRPNGASGPPCCSLDSLEQYFFGQGREWERFAWLKSRVVAATGGAPSATASGPARPTAPARESADAARSRSAAEALRALVLPFVFRRTLDYGVFDSLRDLHRQIREHATRRASGRPERANDVKLSRGGIREIEFIVQLLQVVRGGRYPELRTRETLKALDRVAAAGLMPRETATALAAAYVFLRRVEHRIQYLDDRQTHVLPTCDLDLAWIARTMGHAGTCDFLHALDDHRERVATEFDALLGAGDCKGCQGLRSGAKPPPALSELIGTLPPAVRERLEAWRTHPHVLALPESARQRLVRLVARTAGELAAGRVTEAAVLRMADWIEPLLRRESYIALLLERPAVHERLLRVLGAARWPSRYATRHPGVVDELASDELLTSRFSAAAFEAEIEHRRAAMAAVAQDHDEALLDLLRRAHHAEVFRTLARDVEQRMSVEAVADELSALADAVLRVTVRWCWERFKGRHRETPRLAVIAYGKLGGKELGYGSDLDLVFAYDDADEAADADDTAHDRAAVAYAGFVRKLINWLTAKTGEGDLFEIDTDLRPNGQSGMLVTTWAAYERYQRGRGSNTAWTWEHQAMTRARLVVGEAAQAARFDAVRRAVITAPRDAAALTAEIARMRERVRAAHRETPGRFDLKHGRGAMVDAEFAVQRLVLGHAAKHESLVANVGNIALLERAEDAGLLPAGVGRAAAAAYRELRRAQHQARLEERSTQVDGAAFEAERQAIEAVWQVVFD